MPSIRNITKSTKHMYLVSRYNKMAADITPNKITMYVKRGLKATKHAKILLAMDRSMFRPKAYCSTLLRDEIC